MFNNNCAGGGMRDIEFRAWDKVNQWMDDDFWIGADGLIYDYPKRSYDTPNVEIEKTNNFIIMQYTGLKDKNGTKVFEGDFIKTKHGNLKVIYSEDIAAFEAVSKSGSRSLYGYQKEKDIEVVGNIHEHSHLLEQS